MLNRFVRITFFSLLAVVGLLIVMVALILSIDPNRYRAQISDYLSSRLELPVALQGPLSWHIGTPLGIHLQQIVIGQSKTKRNSPIERMTVGSMDLGIDWLPLFRKQLVIRKLYLDHPQLWLRMPTVSAPEQDTASKLPETLKILEHLSQSFEIDDLSIAQGQVTYTAADEKKPYLLKDINFRIHTSLLKNFSIQLNGQYLLPNLKEWLPFSLETQLRYNNHPKSYEFKSLRIQTRYPWMGKTWPLSWNSEMIFNWDRQTVEIPSFESHWGPLVALGNVLCKNLEQHPKTSLMLRIQYKKLSLTELPGLELLTSILGPDCLTHGDISLKYINEDNHSRAKQIHGNIGDLKFQGDIELFNNPTQPSWISRFHIQQLILAKSKTSHPINQPLLSESLRKWLKNNDLQFNLEIDELYSEHMHVKPLQLEITGKQGIYHWKHQPIAWPPTLMNTEGWLNVQTILPQWNVQQNIEHIPSGVLLQSIRQYSQKNIKMIAPLFEHLNLSGDGTIHLDLHAQGNTVQNLLENMNGQIATQFTGGTLSGLDANRWLQVGYALWEQQSPPSSKGTNKTPFGELKANFYIDNGIVQTQELFLRSDQLTLKGEGQIYLPAQKVALKFWLIPVKELEQPNPFRVPLTFQGPLSDAQFSLDLKTFTQEQLKKQWAKQQKRIHQFIDEKATPATHNVQSYLLNHTLRHWLKNKENKLENHE